MCLKSSMMREMTAEDLLCTQGPLHSAVRSPKQEGNPKKGEICIRRAGPLCRREETNIRLESKYKLQEKVIKNNKKQKHQLLSPVHLFVTPMDCSLPGSSVTGVLQARRLEWVITVSFRGSS